MTTNRPLSITAALAGCAAASTTITTFADQWHRIAPHRTAQQQAQKLDLKKYTQKINQRVNFACFLVVTLNILYLINSKFLECIIED